MQLAMNKKTYIAPEMIHASVRPIRHLMIVSQVNSGSSGIGGGGGAGSSVPQRTRYYDNWAADNWTSIGEE